MTNLKRAQCELDREFYEIGRSVAKNFAWPNVPFAKHEYEEFESFFVERETDEALLIWIDDSARDDAVWIPKRLCVGKDGRLYVKTWFCRKESII